MMKKLINAPEDVLVESLKGVALAHPELSVDLDNHVITRATPKAQGKVAIVSGGGSGHEPLARRLRRHRDAGCGCGR